MTSFQEFLHEEFEEQKRRFDRDRRDEWIAAIDDLNRQIIGWLGESDPEHLLDVIPYPVKKAERGLGSYQVSGLEIGVGDLVVRVVPIARNVAGSPAVMGDGAILAGRVDITDGSKKYMLRRVLQGSSATWEVLDEHFAVTPLDRPRFEAILRDLLS